MRGGSLPVYLNGSGAHGVFRQTRGEIMNKGIIIALAIALAISVIAWLVIHMNRRQPQKNVREMSIRDSERSSNRSAA
jgi:hypothetical protein